MAYATSNPPAKLVQGLLTQFGAGAGAGGDVWVYKSTDADATVAGAGYFTNAADLGMQIGDVVFIHQTNAAPYKVTVRLVTSFTGKAANLSTTNTLTIS